MSIVGIRNAKNHVPDAVSRRSSISAINEMVRRNIPETRSFEIEVIPERPFPRLGVKHEESGQMMSRFGVKMIAFDVKNAETRSRRLLIRGET